jgi:Flp pilus assembly protein TadG
MTSQIISRLGTARERGVAMLEAALVLPILLLLIFGIIDFSRAWNTRQTLTHASREAVRVYTVTEDEAAAAAAFTAAVTGLGEGNDASLTLDPADGCTPGEPVTAIATYSFNFLLLPGFDDELTMTSEAVMRCGG